MDTNKLQEVQIDIAKDLQLFKEYLTLKNYAAATLRTYGGSLRVFLRWREKNGFTGALTADQARQYILFRYKNGAAWQTINGDHSALMKYYRQVKKMDWDVDNLPRPRKQKELPRIVSEQDMLKIISNARNLKDQTFMVLLYATGLRLTEAVSLKIADIDGNRKQLLVKKGKGAKDRYVDIPDCVLEMLRHYYKMYRPLTYLFNSPDRNMPLRARSAQRIISHAAKRAGIQKKVSPHTFRHSYATHHLENGTHLLYLQQQLGHKNLKTTARYIHLVNTRSWRIIHPIAKMSIKYNNRIS